MTVASRLEALERRRDYLAERLTAGQYSEAAAGWATAELAALQWAIPLLRDEVPARLSERDRRDRQTVARNAVRIVRAHPDWPMDDVAAEACETNDEGKTRRWRPEPVGPAGREIE